MHVTGSCHCGQISFHAEVDPTRARICHCTDCQKLSGSAFRTVIPVLESDVEIVSGTPKVYVKTGQNGNKREQAFCGDCGTPIYATSVGGHPRTLGIRTGILDQRELLVPKRQYWSRSAVNWLGDISNVERIEQQ